MLEVVVFLSSLDISMFLSETVRYIDLSFDLRLSDVKNLVKIRRLEVTVSS